MKTGREWGIGKLYMGCRRGVGGVYVCGEAGAVRQCGVAWCTAECRHGVGEYI